MQLRTLVLVVVLMGGLAACGEDESAASRAISDSIMDSRDRTFEVTREQADCMGDGLVADIGVDKLTDYGVLSEELGSGSGLDQAAMSERDARTAAAVMTGCADIRGLFTDAMADLPEESRECVDERLSDQVLDDFLTAVFRGEREQGQQRVIGALEGCVSVEG